MSVGQELTTQSAPLSTAVANLRLGLKAYGMPEWYIKLATSFIHTHHGWLSIHVMLHSLYNDFPPLLSSMWYHVLASGKAASTAVIPTELLRLLC